MGLLRKAISGTLAVGTGGLSLGVVQYRSDTERGTRQTKLMRQDEERRHQEMLALELSAQAAVRRAASEQRMFTQTATSTSRLDAPVPLETETQSDLLAQIERLHALHLAGALTKEEFEAEKQSRINQLSGS